MYDYHMHCNYSSDTNVTMSSMIESAIRRGFKEIAFTDHIDYEYNSPEISFDFDTDSYQKEIEAYQEKYKDKLTIKRGLEVGIQPHILGRCSELVQNAAPDFVIASQHNIMKQDLYLGDYYRGKTPEEAIKIGFEELAMMVDNFDEFCVIGHIDILERYDKAVREMPKDVYLSYAKPVLEKLIAKGKGIEVNTSGLRQGLEETLPSFELLKSYYDLGGRILTIGSDAHQPDDIGHSFKYVLNKLIKIGFENIYTFTKMNPEKVDIRLILEQLEEAEKHGAMHC